MHQTALETIYIYGLYEPDESAMRYVGRTNNPAARLANHVSHPHETIADWIRDVLARGEMPVIKVLDQCEGCGIALENQWIDKCFAEGHPLLNRIGAPKIDPSWPKRGRPFSGGRDPIRGQMRWSDEDWALIQAAVAKSGETYASVARRLLLAWAKRVQRS